MSVLRVQYVTLNACLAPISVECFLSMTVVQGQTL